METVEVRKQVAGHELAVQRGDAIDPMRHDERKFAHVHLVVTHDPHALGPRRVLPAVPVVDALDDLHVTRQRVAHQVGRPPLQGLRHQRVVGISQRAHGHVDRLVEMELMLVDQQAHEFGTGDCRMRVVQLDRRLVGKLMGRMARADEATHDVLQGGGGQQVLLLQPEFLALVGRVVGIEDP
jgi:hypothetical protein